MLEYWVPDTVFCLLCPEELGLALNWGQCALWLDDLVGTQCEPDINSQIFLFSFPFLCLCLPLKHLRWGTGRTGLLRDALRWVSDITLGDCSESNRLQKSTEDLPAVCLLSLVTQRAFMKELETDFSQRCPVKVEEVKDTGCMVAAKEILTRYIKKTPNQNHQ